jgi:hypothetical protein
MASINIFELTPIGVELFSDSESFLNELGEYEEMQLMQVQGGGVSVRVVNSAVAEITNIPIKVQFSVLASIGPF